MTEILTPFLPIIFGGLLGFAILLYVILDGYDLGIGILLPLATQRQQDILIASIGPFWDANETWLVLAVGLLLVAFPAAHGIILTALYLPVAFMLIALIGRGVSFELRTKTPHKQFWTTLFFLSSLLTALSQGWMLGLYIMGLAKTLPTFLFAALTAIALPIGYAFIGSTWLIFKTSGTLQNKAIQWAQKTLWGATGGLLLISLFTPFVSQRLFEKWFGWPQTLLLIPLPLSSLFLILWLHKTLKTPKKDWLPFLQGSLLFLTAFLGMAYSFYPYIVPEKLTLQEAAAAPQSLMIILVGAVIVIPIILTYTILLYRIFKGKATHLKYN